MTSMLPSRLLTALLGLTACKATTVPAPDATQVDLVLRGGTIYDGSGEPPYPGDVAISGDEIVGVGDLEAVTGRQEVDVSGLAVAPGFINMLSWATSSLIEDGRSQSDIRQGVTLEIFGEGWSEGPINEAMRDEATRRQGDIKFDIDWTTLAQYLEGLERRGISTNVASFVGATTVRIHELGYENRAPSPEELERMRGLVRDAMREGALGIGSSLIYAPATFADTAELTELMKVAAQSNGTYITHMRSEGNRLLESVDEVLDIARGSGARAEIWHLKAAGKDNWSKMDAVIERIQKARDEGVEIAADMYNYPAASTGLDATLPPWVQEGGHDELVKRLQDPKIRARVEKDMKTPTDEWENLLLLAGSADKVLLVGFKNEKLKPLAGKTLAEVATQRGKSPQQTVMDLIVEDDSRVVSVYFLMSEENLRKQIQVPWVTFCSDAPSMAPEGVFLKSSVHPRAYGSFARLLGKYSREERVISLEEAVRRLTSLSADKLGLPGRGRLQRGHVADVVVFDPAAVEDRATYDEPHQYARGMVHVFVNGEQVLADREHTGATPGRVVRGPGWKPAQPG